MATIRQATLLHFFRDALDAVTRGSWTYHSLMGGLTALMLFGAYAYSIQLDKGLVVTGMNDYVSWGLYISNFTFLVGVAAAAVMIVLPAYVLGDVDFSKAVLPGEGMAVAAVVMCLAFVTVDMGGPARLWHLIPGVGLFNWPRSMLTWDVIVLNGYLLLNLLIPFYILYSRYCNRHPNRMLYVPAVFVSVFWAVAIHLVTAFLYAGLISRPFWNSALLGPRFLASAFAAGPALMIITLGGIRRFSEYPIQDRTLDKLALITTVAAQVNLVMLGSEFFKEFYAPTEHSASATYLFFGLRGHSSLVPWIWTAIALNIVATLALTVHPIRRNRKLLYPSCGLLFLAIWIEKGMGLIVPGFVPSPLGEVVDYFPTWIEIAVTIGVWAMGAFVFTVLARVAIGVELGHLRAPESP